MTEDSGLTAASGNERSQRDAGTMALFLGFFGAAWFVWGQAAAPVSVRPWLTAGLVLAGVVAVEGIAVMVRNRSQPPGMHAAAAGRRYGVIVGAEFGTAILGALVLGLAGVPQYTAAFICAVVGVHFVPLAPVLADRLLVPLGVATCAVAVLAVVLRLTNGIAPSTVTGIGAGALLTGYALGTLIAAARRPGSSGS